MSTADTQRWRPIVCFAGLALLPVADAAGPPPTSSPVADLRAAAVAPLPPPDPSKISLDVLPAGTERTLVARTCAVCHTIEHVVQRKHTADDWDSLIAKMVGYGAKATDDEQEQIFQYLVRYFRTDTPAPPPAN
jgi:mono/diheme cytochrome c family protein